MVKAADVNDARDAIATDDPELANQMGLDCGRQAGRDNLEAELMELRRKEFQLALRDRYMEKGLLKGASEDQARTDPEYLEYAAKIEKLRAAAEEYRAFSRYFFTRATILLSRQNANV